MLNKTRKKVPWYMLPTIFALAWPTMLEQLLQTAVQYIDTAMVGSLGTEATAAVGAIRTRKPCLLPRIPSPPLVPCRVCDRTAFYE